jgi:cytoskeletal protein RodZ
VSEPPVWGGAEAGDPAAGAQPDASSVDPAGPGTRSHRAPRRGLRERLQARYVLLGLVVVVLLLAFTALSGGPGTDGDDDATPSAVSSTRSSTPTPTASESVLSDPTTQATTTTPEPTAPADPADPADDEADDADDAKPAKPAAAKAPVLVLNNSRITGLAARWASTIENADWSVTRTDNWTRSDLATTTVFYAKGDKAAALAFKKRFDVVRDVRPALSGMGPDLTLVLTSSAA